MELEIASVVKELNNILDGKQPIREKISQYVVVLNTAIDYLKVKNYAYAAKYYDSIYEFLKDDRLPKEFHIEPKHHYAVQVCLCYSHLKSNNFDLAKVIKHLKYVYNTKFVYYMEILLRFQRENYSKTIELINRILKIGPGEIEDITKVKYLDIVILSEKIILDLNPDVYHKNLELMGLFSYVKEKSKNITDVEPVDESQVLEVFKATVSTILKLVDNYGLYKGHKHFANIREKYKNHVSEVVDLFMKMNERYQMFLTSFMYANGNMYTQLEPFIRNKPRRQEVTIEEESDGDEWESLSGNFADAETSTDPPKTKDSTAQTKLKVKERSVQTDDRSCDTNEVLEETPIENLLKEFLYIKSNVDCNDSEYVVKQLQSELDNWDKTFQKETSKGVERIEKLNEELVKVNEEHNSLTAQFAFLNDIVNNHESEMDTIQEDIWMLLLEKYQAQMKEYNRREQECDFMINTLTNIKINLNNETPFKETDCLEYIKLFQTEYGNILEAKSQLMKYFQNEIVNGSNKYRAIQHWPTVPEKNLDYLSKFLDYFKQTFSLLNTFSLD